MYKEALIYFYCMNNHCIRFETDTKLCNVERGEKKTRRIQSLHPAVAHLVPEGAEISRDAKDVRKHETGLYIIPATPAGLLA